jgi:hypothetical protein
MRAVLIPALLAAALAGCATEEPLTCPEDFDLVDGACLHAGPDTTGLSVLPGDLTLTTAASLAEFCAEHNAILGDLTIKVPDATDLAGLQCLRRVGGSLQMDDMHALQTASLPWLEQVHGDLYVQGNPALVTLDLPRLHLVGGGMAFQYNELLSQLVLPALEQGGGFLAVYRSGVERISMPALRRLGGETRNASDVLYIRINLELTDVSFPALEYINGVLKISSNDVLESVSMPALHEIAGGAYISFSTGFRELTLMPEIIGGFLYLKHSHLRRFSLPCLESVGGDLAFNFNERLEVFHLPRLASVGGFVNFQTNPVLPQDQVDDLVDQLAGAIGGPTMTGDNGPPGGTPEAPPACVHD